MNNIKAIPLFIIGKPRSGTKLLTRILETHPEILLEVSETQFIPYYLKRPEIIENLKLKENFNKFYSSVIKTSYFTSYNRKIIEFNEWYDNCRDFDFQTIIETLIRYYCEKKKTGYKIWGDKSNNYIVYISLIKKHLPDSKFIHIVRDVRDASLSSYNAWRTNIFRYSQRWYNDITIANKELNYLKNNEYIQIRYEDLIQFPEKIIKECLDFLGLKYYEELLELDSPSEAVGNAKGLRVVKRDNQKKYLNFYDKKTILEMEKITWPLLKKYNYDYQYSGSVKKINFLMLYYYQYIDFYNRILFDKKNYRNKSIYKTVKDNLLMWAIYRR